MHSDIRDATVVSNSLRAIEQICKLARISLEVQDPKLFDNACMDLLALLKERPYYQPGFETSVLACLKLIKENALPHQADLALRVAGEAVEKVQLLPEQEVVVKTWSKQLQAEKDKSSSEHDKKSNTLEYLIHAEHTLGPIKLLARKATTHLPFFIGANTFSRLCTAIKSADESSTSPLLLVLRVWKSGTDSSRSYWPPNLTIMLNGVNLTCRTKYHMAKTMRSRLNFTINGEGNMDVTRLITIGKNILLVQRGHKDIEDLNLSIESYTVESQSAISERIKRNVLPEHVWRNVLNRLLGKKAPATNSSRASLLPGSLAANLRMQPKEQADLLSISQKSLRISAKCPITLRTIRTPVRGVDCKHYDCFELESYLLVNRGLALWKCPHCNQYTPPTKLVYDLYLQEIFDNISSHASEIVFRKDSHRGETIHYEVISDSVLDDHSALPNKRQQNSYHQDLRMTTAEPCKPTTIVEIDD